MNIDVLRRWILEGKLTLEEVEELTGGAPMILRQKTRNRWYENYANVNVCPKCMLYRGLDSKQKLARHSLIVQLFKEGKSVAKICNRMRLHEPTVHTELRRAGLRWCTTETQIKAVMVWRAQNSLYIDLPLPEYRPYEFAEESE